MADLIPVSICKEEPRANAIFVHGLGGDPYSTWRDGQEFQSFWPRWLAEDIPGLAVYLVAYAASISRWRGAAMHLTDRATNVLARLLAEPQLHKGSLILIGHSLGGLVIKQLLRTAESEARHRPEAADLINRVERVIFLATPHAGSGLANWADRLRILIRPSASTASLVRNDPNLRDLNLWYRDWANAHRISNLILTETETTRIAGMIVPPDSGDPGLAGPRPVPIGSDHRGICKPNDRSSEIYVNIRAFIERPVEAPKGSFSVTKEIVTGDAYNPQGFVAIDTPEAQKSIITTAEGRSQAEPSQPRPFIGVPPRIASFTGRTDALDKLNAY